MIRICAKSRITIRASSHLEVKHLWIYYVKANYLSLCAESTTPLMLRLLEVYIQS